MTAPNLTLAETPTTADFGTIRRTVRFGIDELKHKIADGFRELEVAHTLTATDFGPIREIVGPRLDELKNTIEDGFRDLRQELAIEPRGVSLPYSHRYPSTLERRQQLYIQQLEEERERLRGQVQANLPSSPGNTDSSASITALEARIRQLEDTIVDLVWKNQQLTDMKNAINSATQQDHDEHEHNLHPTDDHIDQAFTTIADQIHSIVQRYCIVDPSARLITPDDGTTPCSPVTLLQRELLGEWSRGLSKERLEYRIQAALFIAIQDTIFRSPYFGLEDFHRGVEGLDIERNLEKFETHLTVLDAHGVHRANIAEWRARTVQCAHWLSDSYTGWGLMPAYSSKAEQLTVGIEQLLAPITQNSQNQDLHNAVLGLCQSGFRLMLLLRLSRDDFVIEMPTEGMTIVDDNHFVYGIDGAGSQLFEEGTLFDIAFAIKGMLVRRTRSGDAQRVVSKAHVVVKSNPNLQPTVEVVPGEEEEL
ncbi:uncharacterized protein BP5553_08328 [Venustampulla echinocandica]|uniref:Uncharacterized protein n=1 Tax=Venustampulla echinocandica TaxID=2656787 RepID=A0A370TGE2_9HELO|nr:uncharacterized protein BP5553_08328 [Venustampulla echinocandica]RDL33960.1 hypothetical protein BP5553_08328 [Venustampulla echinocandica]